MHPVDIHIWLATIWIPGSAAHWASHPQWWVSGFFSSSSPSRTWDSRVCKNITVPPKGVCYLDNHCRSDIGDTFPIAIRSFLCVEEIGNNEFKRIRCLIKSAKAVHSISDKTWSWFAKTSKWLSLSWGVVEIRYHCLTYPQSLKEIHTIDSPNESNALEAEKIGLEKAADTGDLLTNK